MRVRASKRLGGWSFDELTKLMALKSQGLSWADVALRIPGRTPNACQARYYDQRVVSREEESRALTAVWSRPERADLTGRLLGDPPPGRSALDLIGLHQVPRITLPQISVCRE